jgi:hypothetical protein
MGETTVIAIARSPKAAFAAWHKKELSTPPENATAALPWEAIHAKRRSYFSSSVIPFSRDFGGFSPAKAPSWNLLSPKIPYYEYACQTKGGSGQGIVVYFQSLKNYQISGI